MLNSFSHKILLKISPTYRHIVRQAELQRAFQERQAEGRSAFLKDYRASQKQQSEMLSALQKDQTENQNTFLRDQHAFQDRQTEALLALQKEQAKNRNTFLKDQRAFQEQQAEALQAFRREQAESQLAFQKQQAELQGKFWQDQAKRQKEQQKLQSDTQDAFQQSVIDMLQSMDAKISHLDTGLKKNVTDTAKLKQTILKIEEKIRGGFYNKSEYFQIDSELGVFTVPIFREFLARHKDDIPAKIERLKEDLDDESKEAIDLFLDRIQYLLPEKLPGGAPILYKMSELFTPGEMEPYTSGKVAANTKRFRQRYEIGDNKTFLCPIYYESGLSFLDDHVKAQIEGSIAVDCGAYWGDTAIIFAQYHPKAVYAFEPSDRWFAEMTKIVDMNNLGEVIIPVQKGVSDEPGEFFLVAGDTTSHLSRGSGDQRCEVVVLDDFLAPIEGRIGLIKYDVEGADFAALRGSEKTIIRDKPILLTSIYHNPDHFFEMKSYLDGLGLGYKHKIRKLAKSPLCDVMLISWVDQD